MTSQAIMGARSNEQVGQLHFRKVDVGRTDRADGAIVLRTKLPFECKPNLVHEYLATAAASFPERTVLAQRRATGDGWQEISYAAAYDKCKRIAAALLRLNVTSRPILILSGNSISHQLIAIAAMIAGIPYAPISVAYSTLSGDFSRLKHVLGVLDPGIVFAEDANLFHRALSIPEMAGRAIVAGAACATSSVTVTLDELFAESPLDQKPAVTSDMIAKILFTSGSTGTPKGVPTTHRMMCSSLDQIEMLWPFMEKHSPVVLDWLPWSHVFGGSYAVNTVLRYAGSLFIDDGKPTPADIAKTVRNLRDVRPTLYWNVPKGYDLLVPELRSDQTFARSFFERLSLMFYAGASLSPRTCKELVSLGEELSGVTIPMTTSWGLTETAPSITMINRADLPAGNIGVPMPGLELKLVPSQGKYEARVRGPTVMTAYFRSVEATSTAFDEEGFFKTGDAVRLADTGDPSQGVVFDGRVAEDFKLTTGTWVDAAGIRTRVLRSLSGIAMDVVVTGQDREDIGLLIIPVLGTKIDDAYLDRVKQALRNVNAGQTGASQRVVRAAVLGEPLALDSGEITEKGSLNSRLILERHRDLVERLYAGSGDEFIRLVD